MKSLTIATMAVLALTGGTAAHAAAQFGTDALPLETCHLSVPRLTVRVAARCGTFRVPENPAEPDGRAIELAGNHPGTGYDSLHVLGDVTIGGGILDVSLLNGFVPDPNDAFVILRGTSIEGVFENAVETITVGNVPLPVTYLERMVVLGNVAAVPEPMGLMLVIQIVFCLATIRPITIRNRFVDVGMIFPGELFISPPDLLRPRGGRQVLVRQHGVRVLLPPGVDPIVLRQRIAGLYRSASTHLRS
jgi:hypothetical protein